MKLKDLEGSQISKRLFEEKDDKQQGEEGEKQ